MAKPLLIAIFIAALIVVVVGVDILFFREHFWERLAANVGIVLIFVAVYFRFIN